MHEDQILVADTANKIFSEECPPDVVERAERGVYAEGVWATLNVSGLLLAGVDEANGGSGGSVSDALIILREAARKAVPLPLAETFVAGQALNRLHRTIPALPITLVRGQFELSKSGRLEGHCSRVPFGRDCQSFLIPVDGQAAASDHPISVCIVDADQVCLEHGQNISGEPCDRLSIHTEIKGSCIFTVDRQWLNHTELLGAASRAVMMAGALEEMLQLTVGYALERRQFGKAIAKFQAIQQQLAVFAGEVATSTRAADTLMDSGELDALDVAIAKARIGEACGISTEIAHQVHGAIGYTREHRLNQLTRRLWQWRDEFGNENYWQHYVAELFLNDSSGELWTKITELKV